MAVGRKELNKALLERFKAKQDRQMHTDMMVEEFRKGLLAGSGADIKKVNEKISQHSQGMTDAGIRYNHANDSVENEMFSRTNPGAMKWRRAAIKLKVARRALKSGLGSFNRDSERLKSIGKKRLKRI